MWKSTCAAATFALTLAVPSLSGAATVAQGATRVDDSFNIVPLSGSSIASTNSAYDNSTTNPSSDWVWVGDIEGTNSADYIFDFDLAGFDPSTAGISGLWGADNAVSILLNGASVFSSASSGPDNFDSLNSFAISDASLFNAGSNQLWFNLTDAGGPAAFRSVVEVEAAVVPLPATGALLFLGVGGLFGVRRYRRV